MIKFLVFDFDSTLYMPGPTEKAIAGAVISYLSKTLGISEEAALTTFNEYCTKYGSSFVGTYIENKIPFEAQNINFDLSVIAPNPILLNALEKLPFQKVVFTNNRVSVVQEGLQRLGIENLFQSVIGLEDTLENPKPKKESFEILFKKIKAKPHECIFFEDSIQNLKVAKELGMHTVLCHRLDDAAPDIVDYSVRSLDREVIAAVQHFISF